MSESVMPRIEALLKSLHQPVFLLDKQGRCLFPRQPDTFILPSTLHNDKLVSKSGYLFLLLNGLEPRVLACKERPDSGDILLLCGQLISKFYLEQGITAETENALKRLINNELTPSETGALIQELGIQQIPRAVLHISLPSHGRHLPRDTALMDYVPREDEDLLFHLDSHNLVLARILEPEGQDDLMDYAMALLDTIENELGLKVSIGIGSEVNEVGELHQSYRQARNAIQIGQLFHPNQSIFHYRSLVLERFIMDCAPDKARHYISLLFNPQTAKLLTDEMLETVNVFLKRDLNLTDAARDLYIHRNTLVYRLEKIQKGCGLDLRHFNDAMLFKLLDDLRKKETIREKEVKGTL